MTSQKFQSAYDDYIAALTKAGKGATHDYRRTIFFDFLSKAFEIKLGEVEIEEKLRVPEVRGFIDALYNGLIFEFKKDLKREHEDAMRELVKYFIARPDAPVALVTDGWIFDVYVPAPGEKAPRKVGGFVLKADNATDAHLFFDSYLFQDTNLRPTSDDVVMRFGAASPTYLSFAAQLETLWNRVADKAVTQVKWQEWNRLLAKVYGIAVGSDDLFLRHTYLSILARSFAATSLFGEEHNDDATARGLVNGDLFSNQGYPNLGETDFFAWVLHPDIEIEALGLIKMLLGRLRVYDLSLVSEDLLKELYQNLIDPSERHDLGEHYTPDWLAEWTLRESGYLAALESGAQPSLLDPSCGSGTFLFTALKLARTSGLSGHELVKYAVKNVSGMDVHPLAVTISKVNLVLALGRADIAKWNGGAIRLGIFMADTIQRFEETGAGTFIEIPVSEAKLDAKGKPIPSAEKFAIPEVLARDRAKLETVLEAMGEFSKLGGDAESLLDGFWKKAENLGVPADQKSYWRNNCRLLIKLVRENRDTIWTFILKNCFQPAFMRSHKVDFVVGNPPWLSLNGVKNAEYQTQIKNWTFAYGLLGRTQGKLFTQMDLCTLFWAHCEHQFLREGGTIAMVMPRSVLTGAKQHAQFRTRGFSTILEVDKVRSYNPQKGYGAVFNVPSCAIIAKGGATLKADIPAIHAAGKLGARNLGWDKAEKLLLFSDGHYTPPQSDTPFSEYHPEIRNGANIFPRCFWLVHSRATGKFGVVNAARPAIETDPDVEAQAKVPWKGQKISGAVEAEFLFATLLNDNLVPFGVRAFDLCVLPIRDTAKGCDVWNKDKAYNEGFPGLGDWLRDAEALWDGSKKDTTTESSLDSLNHHNKLQEQYPSGGFRVLHNKSGSNLCSCVVDASQPIEAGGLQATGFVTENVMFYFRTQSAEEAHYLCALLNAPYVNDFIKDFQTRGLFGPRDIQRLPFEVLPLPRFDAESELHLKLSQLSREAHDKMAIYAPQIGGTTAAARKTAREILGSTLESIDILARELLSAPPPALMKGAMGSLFAE